LFFFSVLDPLSLVILNLSSLLFFLATSRAQRGLGLFGLVLFIFLFIQAGEFSPPPLVIIFSGLSFALLLRSGQFRGSFYPALASGLITIVFVLVLFALVNWQGLTGWIDELSGFMKEALERSYLHLQEAEVFELQELVKIKGAMGGIVQSIMTLLPGIVYINIMLANVLCLIIFRFLTKNGYHLPATGELKYFSFSDTFVWGLIAGLASLFLPLPQTVKIVFMNVLMVIVSIYLLRGLAVGVYWLQIRGLSSILIGVMYVFLFFLLPPAFFVCLFFPGLLDTWFDFRSLSKDVI
jgi:hypothetical protein